jgi:P27 family predicted phage terminase small subunit
MRGRPRLPTAIKRQRGTLRKHRENPLEPTPNVELLRPPDWLDAAAKREWRRIVPGLVQAGVLTKNDRSALEIYCREYSRWRRCEKILASGDTFATPKGFIQKRPEVNISRESVKLMDKFLSHFGLTPATRSRVNREPPKADAEVSELDAILAMGDE